MHNGNVRKIKRNQMYLSYAKEIFQKKRKTRKDKNWQKYILCLEFFLKKQGVESLSIYLGFKTLISKVFLLADLIFVTQKFVK